MRAHDIPELNDDEG